MVMSRRARLRHRAREVALQLVYMLDMRPDTPPQEALETLSADEALELFSAELAEEGADSPDKEKFPSVSSFDLALSEAAVSYTHLDVYKRQVRCRPETRFPSRPR